MPRSPPSQPTHEPLWVCITGWSAVARPPGESSQPLSPWRIGNRLAIATTGALRALSRPGRRGWPVAGSCGGCIRSLRRRDARIPVAGSLALVHGRYLLHGAVLRFWQEPVDEPDRNHRDHGEADHDPA